MNKDVMVIVQARMGSRRLPHKSCLKLGNNKIVEWVIKRLKKSKKCKNIILATTTKKEDKKLIKIAKNNNILFFRGSGDNVLKRFYDAAKKFRLKNIVRVCADRPFICPSEIDLLVSAYFKNGKKYVFNDRNFKKSQYTDGFGAEVFSFKELKFLYKNSFLKTHKEHVTTFFWDNASRKKLTPGKTNIPKTRRYLRAVIDTKEVFRIMNSFVKKFSINIDTNTKDIVNNLHKYKDAKQLLVKRN